jgi:hypothetical protein
LEQQEFLDYVEGTVVKGANRRMLIVCAASRNHENVFGERDGSVVLEDPMKLKGEYPSFTAASQNITVCSRALVA